MVLVILESQVKTLICTLIWVSLLLILQQGIDHWSVFLFEHKVWLTSSQ